MSAAMEDAAKRASKRASARRRTAKFEASAEATKATSVLPYHCLGQVTSVLPYHLVTSCSNCLGGDCGRFLQPHWLILGLYDAEWTQRTPLTTQMPHH